MLGFNGGRLGSKNVIEQNGIVSPSSDPNYDDVGLILNGGDFVDGSKYAATVTATGVDLSATQNFNRDSYSVLDNDVFTVPDQGQFDLSTNDFTIEGWVYRFSANSNNTFRTIFGKRRGSGGLVRYLFFCLYTGNRFFLFGTSSGSSWDIANGVDTGVALGADTWTHYAVCRQGSSIRIFIAGTLATTITTTASILNDSTAPFQIGTDGSASAFDGGRLAGIRVTNGTARYTANFTPPTAVFDAGTTGFKASGVWTIPEVSRLRRAFVWPGTHSIVSDGLVLNLDAGDTNSYSGTGTIWTDLSGNGNNGTLQSVISYSSDNGGYLDFNGSTDYVTLPEISTAGNEISFDVWNYGITSQNSSIIFLADSNEGRLLNVHLPWSNNTVYFDKGGASYDRISKSVSNSEYQGWHYWAFTANASTGSMKIYLDGFLWHSGTGNNKVINDVTGTTRTIGKNDNNNYHRGYISNLKLYKKELTASQVTQNFNALKGRYGL